MPIRQFACLCLAALVALSTPANADTTEFAMQMSPAMVTALREELQDAARGWQVTTIYEGSHKRLTVVDDEVVEVTEYEATIALESSVKGASMIMMVCGPAADNFTSGQLLVFGSTFGFTDAQLLTWAKNAVEMLGPQFADDITNGLFGPVPEDE